MIISRRKLIGGVGLLFAAPAIVRASSLMPVKQNLGIQPTETWLYVWGNPTVTVSRFETMWTDKVQSFGWSVVGDLRFTDSSITMKDGQPHYTTKLTFVPGPSFPTAAGESAA